MSAKGLRLAVDNTASDGPMTASNGMKVTVNDDGSVEIETSTPETTKPRNNEDFNQNLAEVIGDNVRMNISSDVLDGISSDILSRSDFISNYNKGIDLLGLKLDDASATRGSRQSISKIKNPALLKACVRSQSLTRSQLLPAQGPCKVQTISGESGNEDELARDFQIDFNYFLTKVDRTYYADMNKSLFYRAFGGSVYRKVYRDPILKRPTSRFVPLENFIVSEDASDIHDALRKTNELLYNHIQVKRMQQIGAWLDVSLGTPQQSTNPARTKILQSQGLSAATLRSEDAQRTIYETYLYLCPADYGFEEPMAPEGMPLPYKVVIDKDSRQLLAMHRNWKDGDENYRERQVFVKYGLVSGLGFLDYGFLHLIGNQVRVLTAIWQILVDKGMLSNFPGGLKAKGVRTATNELNPGLGEWPEVDLGSVDDIRKALMPMPYGEISAVFIQLMEAIQKDVEAMAGTLDIPTGEGTANTAVGTILALVEQQSQDLTAVQQNDHRSQEEELRLLRDLFIEYPEDLKHLQRKGSTRKWAELITEFQDMDLVPASDPNIPSQSHRILINQFVMQMAEKAPELFGSRLQKLAKRILQSVGVNDADDLLAPPAEFAAAMKAQQQGAGGKGQAGNVALQKLQMEMPLEQAKIANDQQRIELETQQNQREAANQAAQATQKQTETQTEAELEASKLQLAKDQLASEHMRGMAEIAQEGQTGTDPQAQADLEKTNAQAFAAVGTGAMGLAKANETIAKGQRDAEAIEAGEVPPSDGQVIPPQGQTGGGLATPANKSKKTPQT